MHVTHAIVTPSATHKTKQPKGVFYMKVQINDMVRNQVLRTFEEQNPQIAKQGKNASVGIELQNFNNNTGMQASSGNFYKEKSASQAKYITYLENKLHEKNNIIKTWIALFVVSLVIAILCTLWAINLRDSIIFHNYMEHNDGSIEDVVDFN